MDSRLKIGHLILIFALVALPFAATSALFYPDERHYTDGALMMFQHGQWLVPNNADGSPRFEKPPLAYWAVAAGWFVFGVNALAARLPFLLVSCGTLFLTFRIAKKATGNDSTALLAAVVLAAHPQFFLCSIRHQPDALLTFFITLSGFGFLRLIVWEELTAGAFWMAYGGATGAALSKGLLGIAMILFAWAFAFSVRLKWHAVTRIIHRPALAAATALIGGWIGYIIMTHGKEAWHALSKDQVTGNLDGHVWSPVWHGLVFALILMVNFLPWCLPVAELAARKKTWPASQMPPGAQKFILGWTVLLVAGFSLGSNLSVRYLLPATPLISVLLADWLQNAKSQPLFFSLRKMFTVVLGMLLFMAALVLIIGWTCRQPVLLLAPLSILLGAGIVLLWQGAARKNYFSTAEGLGLALVFGWLLAAAAWLPLEQPDGSYPIAAALRQLPLGATRPVLFVGDLQLASRLRVALGPQWVVTQSFRLTPQMMVDYRRFLLKEPMAQAMAAQGWQVQVIATYPARLPPCGELLQALETRTLRTVISKYGEKIYLAASE